MSEAVDDVDVIEEEESSHSELEDDDYDLLEENLGVKVQRKKFKRVRRISDDSEDEKTEGQGDDREAIAQQLFEGSDNEEDGLEVTRKEKPNRDHYSSDSEEYSDTDDFIVDDEGLPINDGRRQRRPRVSNAVVQEAQDIFGIDFDYNEFERFGEEDGLVIRQDDSNECEDDIDQHSSPRAKRPKLKRSVQEIYEPYELERAGYTEKDNKLRKEDIPERLQTRSFPILKTDEEDLQEEAKWLFKNSKFTGIRQVVLPFPPREQSEANWGDDWDSRTMAPGAAATVVGTSIPPPPASNTDWADEWDKQSNVPVAPTASPSISIPVAPQSDTAWAKNWDDPINDTANSSGETTLGQVKKQPSQIVEIPGPAASFVGGSGGWDNDDWDKGTTVTGIGVPDFVDWKRPAIPPRRKLTTVAPTIPPTIEENTRADDSWADETWETSTTVPSSMPNTTVPAAPLSNAESNQIIIPVPAPDDEFEAKITAKIRNTLRYIRNQNFEVPFIAFYRKEYVMPELSLNDLWKIYRMDARFCELKMKRERLYKLFGSMKDYLIERCIQLEAAEAPIDNTRVISDEHLERVNEIQTVEELKDMQLYFQVHYRGCLLEMKEAERHLRESEGAPDVSEDTDNISGKRSIYKIKRRAGAAGNYARCVESKELISFLDRIGVTSEKFAENLRDKYQRNQVEQFHLPPEELANEIILGASLRSTADSFIQVAIFVMSVQIANEPVVRQCVRKEFFERATVTCSPTSRGQKDIDEFHSCFTMKYLKEKPTKSFKQDEFLKLTLAEKDGLINLTLGENFEYFDETKGLIMRDEFSRQVQDWNRIREKCWRSALDKYILPSLRKELHAKLMEDCYEYIIERCSNKLHHWLKVAPMKITYQDEDEIEWDTSQGIRVLSIAYDLQFDSHGAMVALLRPDGELDVRSFRHDEAPTDRLHLKNLLRRRGEEKEEDLCLLKDFIRDLKPHVIIIAGESREAVRIKEDVCQIATDLVNDDAFPEIKVEIIDNEAAKVYASSKKSQNDLGRDCPTLLKQAISLGRTAQDPLLEFAQLWNMDEDILCIKFHPLQGQIPKERLLERLEVEFINRTCEVGVDINRALNYPHTAGVVQFVCGLGPRKASSILQILRQNHGSRLENRSQLLTFSCMGAKVFLNCAGFIKIDTSLFEDSTESYVEVLDGTRVHPESYEYARRMAVDALYDADETDYNEAAAVEEIMDDPDPVKLNELALDQFAETLKLQGSGDKYNTLFDIREELKGKYKDMRTPFRSLDEDDLFHTLTKETPETLHVGKLVTGTVIEVFRKKPQEDDQQEPVRNLITGEWRCTRCGLSEFAELKQVWGHMDNSCPGPAIGVRIHFENGLSGFIPTAKLSDKLDVKPEERVYPGQNIHCRITKILVDRFAVECTSRTSDLLDARDEWKPKKDEMYDVDRETHDLEEIKEIEERKRSKSSRQVYVKRVIVHPSFRNVTFKEAETLMQSMEQGEVIVRPSSKGPNHLTVTWKVADGITQHVDVREDGKASAMSLGQSLWINDDEFEDIDEIIARHVSPMASHARDIINYRYFVVDLGGRQQKPAEEYLLKQQQNNNSKSHYVFQASKDYPGKFLLSYLPKNSVLHEFVTVTPDGFRFRQQVFDDFNNLLRWFKKHYKDLHPTSTPMMSTNYTTSSGRT